MKVNNICGHRSLKEYVAHKLDRYASEEKTLETLFRYMFDANEDVMVEMTDGYRIKNITYGEFKQKIMAVAPTLAGALTDVEPGSMIGLYCQNRVEWLELFWAILVCGYRPLLMNTRLPHDVLEGILSDYAVPAVISDGETFSVKTLHVNEVAVPSDEAPLERPFGEEVIFMSSGTTEQIKLCAYTGENFYYQVCDSLDIIGRCPLIARHYKGELKQLVLLPLYHVFGFIAVYLWFGFFSRTFVFPKDLSPITIQNTVKKHEVTHIFAVPMVWEAVYRASMQKIRTRGERTQAKFERATAFVNKHGRIGDVLARRLLSEVREGLFGNSIQFLITGGSHVTPETLRFFNGIGYHLANGYGMTEIGITSLEQSNNKKMLNSGSIGLPLGRTEYVLDEQGCLCVRSRVRAARIIQGDSVILTDYDKFFTTNDLARCENGHYFVEGRADDLIVGESGENLNPVLAETQLHVAGVDRLCIFSDVRHEPVLIVSVPGCFSEQRLNEIYRDVCSALKNARLEQTVRQICFTQEPLLSENEFKVSRKKLAARYAAGEITVFDPRQVDKQLDRLNEGLARKVCECFAEVLGRETHSIGLEDNFFLDLGGSSIDYFSLLGMMKQRFGIELGYDEQNKLATVKDFCDYIKNC